MLHVSFRNWRSFALNKSCCFLFSWDMYYCYREKKKKRKFLNTLPYPAQYFMQTLVQIVADSHSVCSFTYPFFDVCEILRTKNCIKDEFQYFSLVNF